MESAVPGLLVTTPKGHSRSVPLENSPLSLGRAPENDLSFPEDDGLSRRHLVIEPEGARWSVTDLGSKNGTYVNDTRIRRKHYLKSGDRISASCISITYTGGSAAKD
jgi:pSer/pThr/pTyr-binding forkhead associated (FHA) protein